MLVTGTTTVPRSWARRCAPPCCATRSAPCCGSRTSSRSTAASRSSLKPYAIAWRRRARQPTTRTRRARCPTHNSGSRGQARQFLSPGCGRFSSLYKCERLIFILANEYLILLIKRLSSVAERSRLLIIYLKYVLESSVSFPTKIYMKFSSCSHLMSFIGDLFFLQSILLAKLMYNP